MQNNFKKQKEGHLPTKINLGMFFFMILSYLLLSPVKTYAWIAPFDAIPGAIFKQAQEEISYTIKGMIMGSMKQAAVKMLSQQMDSFISGGGSGPKFITNWQDYLIAAPARNAQTYANDYISRALAGRGSSSYQTVGSVLGASTIAEEGFGKEAVLGASDSSSSSASFAQSIQTMAQDTIVDIKEWQLSYPGDPAQMFQGSSLSNLNLYLLGDGNGGNTIWDAESAIAQQYAAALESEKAIASAQSIANQGFISDTTSGIIDKPGILYKEMQANADNLPNLAVTSANSIGELAAAAVSKVISSAVNKAVSGVKQKVNQQITTVNNKASSEINKTVDAYGPGALYK
ncbi:MAG: hypothetical protein WC848_01920 [Parcubacteria group bacterium]|jgi:hypothetical protein